MQFRKPGWSRLFGWCLVLIGLLMAPRPVQAAVNQFTVTPLLPSDNAATKGYFDLTLPAGTKRTLQLRLHNEATTAQTLVVTPTNAITGTNGVITYPNGLEANGPTHPTFGSVLTQPLAQKVRLAAGASKTVSYAMTVPKFRGLILGAFAVNSQTAKTKGAKRGGLVNLAQYLIGVSLHGTPATVTPRLKLPQVRYSDKQNRPQLTARINNDQPALVGKVTLLARVYRGQRRVTAHRFTGMNFAPANRFWVTLPLDVKSGLSAGRYRLVLTVHGDNGHWRLAHGFTVSGAAGRRALVHRLRLNWPQLLWWAIDALAAVIVVGFLIRQLWRWARRKQC